MESAAQFLGDIATNSEVVLKGTKTHVDGIIADLRTVGLKTTAEDAQSLATYLAQMKTGDGVDDRMMRQEKLMSWLFKLPLEAKSAVGNTLEQRVVQSLWDTLSYPDAGWTQFSGPQYRRADGEGNNVQEQQVDRAGEAYIRNVVSRSRGLEHGKDIPGPEDSFEKLFRRQTEVEGGFRKHPCGISANMFYMATLVTHDLFNTISRTGSETRRRVMWICLGFMVRLNHICLKSFSRTLTLGARHTGWNQEMQDSVRDEASHRGKLYADVSADALLDLQPPGVISMALLWCRNHNWIAEQLLIKSKDNPRFANIPKNDDKKRWSVLMSTYFRQRGISTWGRL